jgi:hypothetical protein
MYAGCLVLATRQKLRLAATILLSNSQTAYGLV